MPTFGTWGMPPSVMTWTCGDTCRRFSALTTGGTTVCASLQLDALTHINLDELVSSFGWQGQRVLAPLVRRVFSGSARKLAGQMLEFDDVIGREANLSGTSRVILQKHYIRDLHVDGLSREPPDSSSSE